MSTSTSSMSDRHPVRNGFAGATTIAAGALLAAAGILSILQGISALANDDLFVVGPEYLYSFDITGWGWIHLLIGILVVATAIGLFAAATWARAVAIVLAAVSIVANFLWLPYYPWWAVLVIALDILVIWAVATWSPDFT
ncbi:DUF7144 family membrane protein [Rhodococcus yananensis]|uniref:DUF7144 family membrane protein n=1 Tax=Rhodococcus yananensis TaxID=2879464 RepID=UPI001CF85A7B|nr:hypothetical protein [Rhodococcus yananensis]